MKPRLKDIDAGDLCDLAANLEAFFGPCPRPRNRRSRRNGKTSTIQDGRAIRTVTLDPDLNERLQREAQQQGRPVSHLVEDRLRESFDPGYLWEAMAQEDLPFHGLRRLDPDDEETRPGATIRRKP